MIIPIIKHDQYGVNKLELHIFNDWQKEAWNRV